jgi:alpha-maltose-1-phosphate synthase
MKLLMVTNYYDSHLGGIELVAEKLFRGLAQRQCDVVWAAANVTAPPLEDGCGRALPLKSWNGVEAVTGLPLPVPGISALKELCSRVGRADIVLLHDCLYLSNIAAFLRARALGKPITIVQHTRVAPYQRFLLRAIIGLANALITRPMLKSAQQVIFVSQNIARDFASVHFRQQPELVFNGVDTKMFRPLSEGEDKNAIREHLGLPRNGIVTLFVGRFIRNKGILIMKRMVEMRPEWTWAFAGWGPLDPSRWNAANVRVFSGLRGDSIAQLYRACDLLVLPSMAEGFGLVVPEALASGLPVVCTADMLGADETMRGFVRGAAVYAGDGDRTARDFLAAIDETIDSDKGKTKPADRHSFAVSRYSWDAAVNRYLEITSRLTTQPVSQVLKGGSGTGDRCR